MIKSMTGFASLTHEDARATIGITVRAVNHRFLDIQLRIPQSLADLESRVRALLQKRLARGRVELAIAVQVRNATTPTVELNEEFANALSAAIDRARERGLVDVPQRQERLADADALVALVRTTFAQLLLGHEASGGQHLSQGPSHVRHEVAARIAAELA